MFRSKRTMQQSLETRQDTNLHPQMPTFTPMSSLLPNDSRPTPPQSTCVFGETSSSEPVQQMSQSLASQLDIANELKLLTHVEIIDEKGNPLRIQTMGLQELLKLKRSELVKVHVNENYQLIKAAGSLCSKFMSFLLNQPSICPLDVKDWRELKTRSGVKLITEIRGKFNLPLLESVDNVILKMLDEKFRGIKHRMKEKLFKQAAKVLDELKNNVGENAQFGSYTEQELLDALDYVELPSCFVDHQWERYKSNLRTAKAKKMSENGKRARAEQIHAHTTGAMSYARKDDVFRLEHQRSPKRLEFFELTHKKKDGSFIHEKSKEFLEKAKEIITERLAVLENSEDVMVDYDMEKDVITELIGPDRPGQAWGYGVGITKSHVTKFSHELRKMRMDGGAINSNQIPFLLNRIKTMEQTIEELRAELLLFRTTFREIFGSQIPANLVDIRPDDNDIQVASRGEGFDIDTHFDV